MHRNISNVFANLNEPLSIEAYLYWLVQGGQVYKAFFFSQGSLISLGVWALEVFQCSLIFWSKAQSKQEKRTMLGTSFNSRQESLFSPSS